MRGLSRLGRSGKLIVAVTAAGAAFGIATAVQASIPDSNQIVHSCYNTSLAHGNPIGAMRAIDTSTPSGNCAPWEGAVDLATPQYVQNVVTTTINQTSITGTSVFTYPVAGHWLTYWVCPTGYIGTSTWIEANQFFGANADITIQAKVDGGSSLFNAGSVAGQPYDQYAEIYYDLSTLAPNPTYITGVTCIDSRVYGQAGPAVPLASPKVRAVTVPVN